MVPKKAVGVYINAFRIDASVSERHSYQAEATEFPVESGGTIVDHVRALPVEVTIEGVVSNTPIGEVGEIRSIERVELGNADGTFTDVTPTPVEQAIAVLEGLHRDRAPVEITTSLQTYKNMAMISLDIPRDASGGGDHAVKFTATFRQIVVVTTERVKVKTATPGSGKKRNKGPQPAPKGPLTYTPGRAGPVVVGEYWFDNQIHGWRKGYTNTGGSQTSPGRSKYNEGEPLVKDGAPVWRSTADDKKIGAFNITNGAESPFAPEVTDGGGMRAVDLVDEYDPDGDYDAAVDEGGAF